MDVEDDAARPAADALTAAEVEKMKVYDLKLALDARGLSTEGLKKVLKARLLEPGGVARVAFVRQSLVSVENRSSRPGLVPRVSARSR